ncbi:MAG: hypothetical protein HQL66_00795 [Magnetococcales bacterium]|nr:hypothetical protein [Magnetococcales bacterium]
MQEKTHHFVQLAIDRAARLLEERLVQLRAVKGPGCPFPQFDPRVVEWHREIKKKCCAESERHVPAITAAAFAAAGAMAVAETDAAIVTVAEKAAQSVVHKICPFPTALELSDAYVGLSPLYPPEENDCAG